MPSAESNEHKNHGFQSEDSDSEGAEEEPQRTRILKKRRLTRRAMTIVGSIAVAALALSTVWVLSGISDPQVTIVAILPLSGASSYLVEIQDAMSLTVEKLNKWGGINGMRIRLVVKDCASSSDVAVGMLLEAEEKYHPLAVVTATRDAAYLMSEIAEENGIVLISMGATAGNLTEGKEWIFRFYVAPSDEADNALETIKTLNVSSLGILHLDDVYGNSVMNRLTESFEALGGSVESYGFAPNCTEFSDAVAEVIDNDAVFAIALRHQVPIILNELNSSGYAGHILGAVEASIPEMWGLPDAQGCFVSAPIMYSSGGVIDKEFMMEFEERYGEPLTHQGAIGSDVIRLIWGLLSDSDVSRESLRDLLNAGFVYSGILGIVTDEQGDHNTDIPTYPAVIEGGGLRYL
ncbi:MAG: ABC transporter substrate-binding protein [Thermoplasmata archaeon]|nr:ABC transporter substrate-binding protein [Thermoplasmata archaeon]TFG71048.1 MAG: ABC transporter substrate-binding protein [Methanomassiliicoccus sp.]